MELTEKQYRYIESLLPKQRGKVTIANQTLLNTLIYRCEHGGKGRNLPQTFGHWQVIYVRLNRWAQKGVLERVFNALVGEKLLLSGLCCLDSTAVKTHPDIHGARKKRSPGLGKSRGGWNEDTRTNRRGHRGMVAFRLSGGNIPDAIEERLLLESIEKQDYTVTLGMDRAYEDERTRIRAGELGFNLVVPPKGSRVRL
ncbi:MAG: IS5 family transposase [Treponema sp.]|jgi:transposase|nr:IS5 family transposase [Treponema sp.]